MSANEHRRFGKGLTTGKYPDNRLNAGHRHAGDFHPAFENEIEGVGGFSLPENDGALVILPRRMIADETHDRLVRYAIEQRR